MKLSTRRLFVGVGAAALAMFGCLFAMAPGADAEEVKQDNQLRGKVTVKVGKGLMWEMVKVKVIAVDLSGRTVTKTKNAVLRNGKDVHFKFAFPAKRFGETETVAIQVWEDWGTSKNFPQATGRWWNRELISTMDLTRGIPASTILLVDGDTAVEDPRLTISISSTTSLAMTVPTGTKGINPLTFVLAADGKSNQGVSEITVYDNIGYDETGKPRVSSWENFYLYRGTTQIAGPVAMEMASGDYRGKINFAVSEVIPAGTSTEYSVFCDESGDPESVGSTHNFECYGVTVLPLDDGVKDGHFVYERTYVTGWSFGNKITIQ